MPSPGQQAGTWCGLAGPQGSVLFPSTGTMLAPSPVCVCDGAERLPVISGPSPRWALALVVQVGVSCDSHQSLPGSCGQGRALNSKSLFEPQEQRARGLGWCFLEWRSSQHALCSRPFHNSLCGYNPRACWPGPSSRSSKGWLASSL